MQLDNCSLCGEPVRGAPHPEAEVSHESCLMKVTEPLREREQVRKFIRENRKEIDAHIRSICSNVGSLNDNDREQWISNDEGLYNWARSCGVKV